MQRRALISALFLLWLLSQRIVVAQTDDPFSVRVDSNLVIVYAEVVDERQRHLPGSESYVRCTQLVKEKFVRMPASQPYLPDDCSDWMIHDLGPSDFRIFEDGVEQQIQSVTIQRRPDLTVRDSLGWHEEWSHTPRGRWSATDIPNDPSDGIRGFSITYVPRAIAQGKCHHLELAVRRPHAIVFAPKEYCYVPHPASDPLLGTQFGKHLEISLDSGRDAKIQFSVTVSSFRSQLGAHVDVVMEFRWDSLDHTFVDGDLKAKIGVLGKLYRKAGTLVTRFSDLAFDGPQNGPHTGEIEGVLYDNLARSYLPSRYETQFEAPPGNYELHLILGDGRKFGRAIVPIDIPDFSAEQLAISSVVLFKRFRNAATAAAESAAVNLAPEYVPRVSQEMQVTPATDLNFKRGTPVATYFEVYAPVVAENPALKIEARIRVVSAKTGSSKDYPWFDLAPYRRGTSETFAVAQSPNTDGLPKGSYQLQVQARDSAGHVTAWQVSPFTLK